MPVLNCMNDTIELENDKEINEIYSVTEDIFIELKNASSQRQDISYCRKKRNLRITKICLNDTLHCMRELHL